jgi:ribosomal 50S subunit-recycling heat shock protein
MRLDSFLKKNRIIKRRTVAKEAIEKSYVRRNGQPAKPGTKLNPGDKVEVRFANRTTTLLVKEDFSAELISESPEDHRS